MADFSDVEDRRLFRLAKTYVDARQKINWKQVSRAMTSTGKSQHQLQIRLKTLKKTYGNNLNQFPKQFFIGSPRLLRVSCPRRKTNFPTISNDAQQQVIELFASISPQQIWPKGSSPDAHPGELTPSGVAALFATSRLPRLAKVFVHNDDIRTASSATQQAMYSSTVVFSNNLVFDPTSNNALESFATHSPNLVHLVTTQRVCCRHRDSCQRAFCSVWKLHREIPITASWSAKDRNAFWYTRQKYT
eukprot:jgi/Phyca11/132140/e_gw1.137.8.1